MYQSLSRVVVVAAILTVGCSSDPNKAKSEAFASGNKYFAAEKFNEATVEYRRAVQIDPKFGEARAKLGETYLKTGDIAGALRETVRAADLLPANDDVQIRAGNLLLASGSFQDARTRAEQVLSRSPKHVDALVLRGNAMAGLKDLDGALTEFEKAAAADPKRGTIQSNIGAIQLAKGATAEAETAFRTATEVAPSSSLARVAYANFLLMTKRPELAERELKAAVTSTPNDPIVRRALVLLYLSMRRPADAEPHLRALADNSKEPEARFALARFYFATNRPQDALRELEALAARKDSYADATIEIAASRYRSGQTAEARRQLSEVLTQAPTHARARLLEAEFLAEEHKWPEAITAAKAAIERDPRLAGAYFVLGLAHQGQRDFDEARQAFNEVLKLQPNASGAQLALAELHLLNRDPATAQQFAKAAAAQAPQSIEARATLTRALLAGNDLTAAEQSIKALKADFPQAADSYVLEGSLHLLRKNLAAAGTAYAKAEQLNADSVTAASGRVQVLLASGKAGDAKVYVDRLTTRHADDPAFLLLAARAYATMRDYGRAEPLLRTTLERDPARTEAYAMLAQLYLRDGKPDQALVEFQTLAAKQPKSESARTMVGTILQMTNRRTEAKEAYRQVLGLNPSAPVAANNLAWMLAEDNENLDNALQLAQAAKVGLPDSPNAADTLGWVYLKKGLAARAIPEFVEALAKEPGNAGFHYRLGFAYAQDGQLGEARRSLEKALSLDPKAPEATEAKAALARLSRLGS
jgi:tetratricopeptide (TPR) repeat protein